jgi:hypothetical protein
MLLLGGQSINVLLFSSCIDIKSFLNDSGDGI